MDLIIDGEAARIQQIEQITRVKVLENDTHSSCSICISDFTKNEIILILPCVHKFHRACIQTWLAKNNTCPTCRETVFQMDPVWNADDTSSDESVDVAIADLTFDLNDSMNSHQHSSEPDNSDVLSESDDSNDSNMSSEPDLSEVLWEYPGSPTHTLEIEFEMDDSSNEEASDDSSDNEEVMNESQITVSSESDDDSEHSDGMVFPVSSDESSESDVMLYESSDSSD